MEVGSQVHGRVVANGEPVKGVSVSLTSSASSEKTDEHGNFNLRYSEAQTRGGPVSIGLRVPKELNFLTRSYTVNADDLDAEKRIDIELEQGVRLTGKVLCNEVPAAGVSVSTERKGNDSWVSYRTTATKDDGTFELVVPAAKTKIFLTADKLGYKLATRSEGFRASSGSIPGDWPQQSVELTEDMAGQTIALEPFHIEPTPSVAIRVLMPDGKPATQGEVTIKEKAPGRFGIEEVLADSKTIDQNGQATLKLRGTASPEAFAMVRVFSEGAGYSGKQKLGEAGPDGVLEVKLEKGMLLRGNVLLNGEPVQGARVRISKSEPANARGGFTSRPILTVQTNAAGAYEAAVERVARYSIFVESVPGIKEFPNSGHGAVPNAEGVVEIRTFDFRTGLEEIRGIVVGSNRKPIEGVTINVDAKYTPEGRPTLVGWRTGSLLKTGADGKFVIRNLPKGDFQVRAYMRQNGQHKSCEVEAKSGATNVKLFMDTDEAPAIPRLPVKSITDY